MPAQEHGQSNGDDWQRHVAGRLVLHVRPYSSAARDVDEATGRYAETLASVSDALDVDASSLPAIAVYLSDLPGVESGESSSIRDEQVAIEPTAPHEVTIWTTYGNESPSIGAEVELARALVALALHRLQQRAPFSALSAAALDALCEQLEPIDLPANRDLYHRGDRPDAVYVLLRGRIELRFPRESGRTVAEQVRSGSLIGDQTFVANRTRPATAHVVSDALLYRLSREAWEAVRRVS